MYVALHSTFCVPQLAAECIEIQPCRAFGAIHCCVGKGTQSKSIGLA